MQSKNRCEWYEKIDTAIAEKQRLKDLFENEFVQDDWNKFIGSLVRDSLPFSLPDFAFNSPIVSFISVFKNLNEGAHNSIKCAIEEIFECLLSEELDSNTKQDAANAFLIAYATPIDIENIDLLKNIASEYGIGFELRTYAARLIADNESTTDIDWWRKIIATDDESTIAPIAVNLFAEQSPKIAVDFLNSLRKPSPIENVDNFKIVIKRLLEQILDRNEEEDRAISLDNFPDWCLDYIKRLVQIDKFSQLKERWIESSQARTILLGHKLKESQQILHNLPLKDYDPSDDIDHDETAKKIQFLLTETENEVYRIFMLGKNEGGTGTTSRAIATGYHFVEFAKDVFNSIIFIGSNVTNIDEMLVLIKDKLNDEEIKKCSNNNENIINSLEELYKIEDKKTLIIIDDFHKKHPDQQKAIGNFIKKIEHFCKVLIAMQNKEEEIQRILDYNSDLIPNSDKVYIPPKKSQSSLEQQSDQVSDKIYIPSVKYQSDREQKKEFLTRCYIGNPLAIKLALATTSKLTSCPLPLEDKDPVWYSFQESFKELDDSSKELLVAISIFYKSEIFHDLSLNQEALEHIVSNKINKAQAKDAIKKLKELELISFSDKLDDFRSITIADSIWRCTLRLENLQDIEERENIIFTRLTEYYIDFVTMYGGSDWNNKDNFDKIEIEWYNILAILEWNKTKNDFDKIKTIWLKVNRLADLYGHWEDRIKWLDVLMHHYKNHNDVNGIDTYAQCLSSKGWTLTMFGDRFYQEAQKTLEKAWKLEDVNSWRRSYISHNLTILYYRRGSEYFGKAKDMITEQEALLYYQRGSEYFGKAKDMITEQEALYKTNQASSSTEDKPDLERLLINILRDKAKIEFLEGNYIDAHKKYLKCLRMSQEIDWVRMTSYFNYMLAATLLKQTGSTVDSEKLDRILSYIAEGIHIAKSNNSRRRLAYFKELYASLLRQKGDSRAEDWDKKAKDDIKKLGLKDSSYSLTMDLN
jgi:adenylate kinase family enzyme